MVSAHATPSDGRDLRLGVGFGLLLIALSIVAGPGLASSRAVIVNSAAVVIGLGLVAWCRSRPGRPGVAGQWSVAIFGVFIALSGFSITWSVDPSATWDEVNRLLGYLAVFTGAVVCARTFPARWRSVLLGLALASVGISIVALLSKITPETIAPNERYARLREPLQYWNAVGLIAAFGVPLWLYYGTRRVGRPVLDILSAPALTVAFVVIMLSYSRGALVAAVCAVAVWIVVAPVRLRSVAALVLPLVGAAVIVLWAFAQTDLTTDNIDLLQRETAGHRFGAVVLVTIVLVTLLSLLMQFLIASRAPTGALRRRIGFVLLCGVLLVPIAGAAALTQSQRGLTGTISNGWTQLTNPEANTVAGSNPANSPNRLTSAGNARSLYWRDAFRLAKAHPVIGVGANGYGTARLRVRTDTYDVEHAHGFLVQVLADLGFVGLAVALALWASWIVAVKRTLGRRKQPWPAERVASVALLAAVVAFGVHSSIDWTWSFPAATLPALIAAGWLAGRGSIGAPSEVPNPAEAVAGGDGRAAAVGRWVPRLQLAAFMLLALWSITEPYRAFRTGQQALAAISEGNVQKAVKLSKKAVDQDDVSLDTHAIEAAALVAGGDVTAARAAIDDGVAQQPNNPAAWVQLFNFELYSSGDAKRAVAAYRAATYLDPYSSSLRASLGAALAAAPATGGTDPVPTGPASTTVAPATTP